MTLAERFWSRVNKDGPIVRPDLGACWVWTAGKNGNGYGSVWAEGFVRLAHRVAVYLTSGSWPKAHLLHRCDNPPCVRPDHCFEGSQADNVADMISKGRDRKRGVQGSENRGALLTESDVIDIRSLNAFGATQGALARAYGMSQPRMHRIIHRKAWRHVA